MSATYAGRAGHTGRPGHTVRTGHTGRPVRRVRHEVRDGLVCTAFSAAASCGLAVVLLLLVQLVG